MITDEHADKRIQKTLNALRDAFFDLVLTYSYDEIKISDIIKKADIGRSTFYQHFKSKDEILVKSMHGPLLTLTEVIDQENDQELLGLMEHFWENRRFAPRIFSSTARRHIIASLAEKMETTLKRVTKSQLASPTVPISLFSRQLAEAQMVPIIDWLLGKGNCAPNAMAHHISSSTVALVEIWLKKCY